MDTNNEQWVTIAAAAEALSRSERTIRRWASDGRLPADRSGPVILVDVAGQVSDTMAAAPDMAGQVADAVTPEIEALRAKVVTLQAEVRRLGDVLAEVRSERDYLRQAHAASMQNVALLTERAEDQPRRFRWPWQRRQG